MGFMRSKCDYVVYYKSGVDEKLIVEVYVDELIITSSNPHRIQEFKVAMRKTFEMANMGSPSSCLGIEMKQCNTSIWLIQRIFDENILNVFKMSECNSVKRPMEVRLKLQKDRVGEEVDSSHFRSLIGSLGCLVHTRTDITFSVSRFMDEPTSEHLNAGKRVLRYLKRNSMLG